MNFMDDHVDSRPIEEIYIDQYINFDCKILSKPNLLTVRGAMSGFSKQNVTSDKLTELLSNQNVIDTLNPIRPIGEIVMISRRINAAQKEGKFAVYFNSKVYLLDKNAVQELKRIVNL